MLQNIRVDVIYYMTNTDFEMEFNLCGCCRMRLLTDKASDKSGLISMLARAVSRSRVIIMCGPLFSEDGLIKTVSAAIHHPTETADSNMYGINGDTPVEIIGGSTPLVTKEGYFGGCIIESGPQTIILLTDNKNIRKSIMGDLIHPYIDELSHISEDRPMHLNSEMQTEVNPEPELPSEPELLSDAEITESESSEIAEEITEPHEAAEQVSEIAIEDIPKDISVAEQTDSEEPKEDEVDLSENSVTDSEKIESEIKPESESTFKFEPDHTSAQETVAPKVRSHARDKNDAPFSFSDEEDEIEMYVEPKRVRYNKKSYYETEYYNSQNDGFFYTNQGDEEQKIKNDEKKLNLPIIIIAVILLVLLAVLAYFIIYIPYTNGMSTSEYLSSIFNASGTATVV